MDSHSNLSVEVVEHVLSFLPIPTICRMRVVCKEWNHLTNNATFHALCNKNGKNEDYLFLWRIDNFLTTGRKSISPGFGATFHFMDLKGERWYSIPSTQVQRTRTCGLPKNMAPWFLSMDSGLVCEVFSFYNTELEGRTLDLSILDPIAETSTRLPSLDLCFPPSSYDAKDPSLVIVVDQDTQSYKVFFFNTLKDMPLAYVLELGTPNWRPVGGFPSAMDNKIAFRNTVFASLNKGIFFEECCQVRLFRYQVEGDTFAKVWEMNFPRQVVYSKLLVRHNRLFVLVITRRCQTIHSLMFPMDKSEPESEFEACFQTCQDEEGALFEMYEILLEEGSAKPVVQFTEDVLYAIWEGDMRTNFWLAFPCLDSKGGYSSIVLIHHHTGEMRRFHIATGAVDALPACPLSTTIPDMENVTSTFDAKTMPLSLRDVLNMKHAPPAV